MNTKKRLTNLLAVVALGAGMAMGFAPTADAAPRHDGDVKDARKEIKDERKDLKKAKKEVRKADTKEERREAKQDVREERKNVKKAKKDVKQERRENRRDNNNGGFNSNNDYRSFTGTVTDVKSNRGFKLRVGNQSFDVLVNNQFPRGFDEGDIVRVYGLRNSDNSIGNASVAIVNNR